MRNKIFKKPVTGLHILGEIYTSNNKSLCSLNKAKEHISKIIKLFHLRELGSFYYQFPQGGGFTGIISLVESHIAIHTWPELNYLTLDVYLCNYTRDNSEICRKVFREVSEFFKPHTRITRKIIMR